jgi:hypothetical protein
MEMSILKENIDKKHETSDTFLLPHPVVESERGPEDGEGCKESSTLEGIPRMNESEKIELNTTYFTPKLRCRPRRLREKKRSNPTEWKAPLKPLARSSHSAATYL